MELSGTGRLNDGAGVRMQRAGRPGERKWRREHGGGWWWWCMKCWCWGCLRDGHPLAVQRRRTAPRGLMAAQCHMAAEEGLEGAAGQVGA